MSTGHQRLALTASPLRTHFETAEVDSRGDDTYRRNVFMDC